MRDAKQMAREWSGSEADARQVFLGGGVWFPEESVFGVQNQPSEARVSKLKYMKKQAGGGCAAWRWRRGGNAKATRGDNAVRSSSSPSAGDPVLPRTSSPASGTFPSSYDHRDPWVCPE